MDHRGTMRYERDVDRPILLVCHSGVGGFPPLGFPCHVPDGMILFGTRKVEYSTTEHGHDVASICVLSFILYPMIQFTDYENARKRNNTLYTSGVRANNSCYEHIPAKT